MASLQLKDRTQYTEKLGLTVQTATADLARQFDVKPGEGVIVTEVEPGSIAVMAGISRGMVILEINRKPVNSSTEFKQAIRKTRKGCAMHFWDNFCIKQGRLFQTF